MKSAYELAMERLEKTSPTMKLSEEKKRELADIESTYRARIAEKELFLRDEIKKAAAAGRVDEVETIEQQLTAEMRRLGEECEAKKEKVRTGT